MRKKQQHDMYIAKEHNIIKLFISDYISFIEYAEKMKKIDVLGIENVLSNFLLWNNDLQLVNKGEYNVIIKNNIIYNFLISDDLYVASRKDGADEKILKKQNNDLQYLRFNQDSIGSSTIKEQLTGENVKQRHEFFEEIKNVNKSFYDRMMNSKRLVKEN